MVKQYFTKVILKVDFNIIVETLTRIGVLKNDILYQSVHILHNKGNFYLIHFKELFSLYSFKNERKIEEDKIFMSDEDFERRNSIIFLIKKWNMIEYLDEVKEYIEENKGDIHLDIIKFEDKGNYKFISKFTLGKNNENI